MNLLKDAGFLVAGAVAGYAFRGYIGKSLKELWAAVKTKVKSL